ncbi:cell envelope-related function transcriptional attenuator common domain-containing protein [Mycolicibacterium neoaurum]|nr:cell envelope-related function transcriptional attenuator common domain-containing protein [Mycolicibacterium neoaurum]
MPQREPAGPVTDVLPQVRGPRHRMPRRGPSRRGRVLLRTIAALVAVATIVITGIGWSMYRNIAGGITTSEALAGAATSTGGDQNILIMGLDSRLDQHGNPLPKDLYDALHAGDETVGGYNANVLILLHVPGGNGPVTAVSIPRDDYVRLHGCPSGECQGKIKQAYGLAYQETMNSLADSGSTSTDPAANEQIAREAGRKAQINTISDLLRVPVDHFIEVTLGAFFQIAQVVQPITVCLNDDTADDFSGADFHRGIQQIDAAQSMAFVRQRRDLNNDLFTDLDRTRRQQAFIVSLVKAVRDGGSLSNPAALRHLAEVAKQNVAVDAGFDMMKFVDQASAMSDKPMSLYTLPIGEFGQDPLGQDVNIVDVTTIRSIVQNLFQTGSPNPPVPAGPSTSTDEPAAVNVVNATGHAGLANSVAKELSAHGFTRGDIGTAEALSDTTTVEYGPGAEHAAAAVANDLPIAVTSESSSAVPLNTVVVTIGSDYPVNGYESGMSPGAGETAVPAEITTVDATATGTHAPAPTDLTEMSGARIPCVR